MTGFRSELENNILRFWLQQMRDEEHGGFYGRMTDHLIPKANKGLVLNARLLWTFSAAFRILKKEEYRKAADRAFHYLIAHFHDPHHQGFYWELDYLGRAVNTKKQTYAQAFALYGLSEYHRATGSPLALNLAKETFAIMESHMDKIYGGYFEAFSADWQPLGDVRLSDKDYNEKKSMNTHLHVLEAYTNFLRLWPADALKAAHQKLLQVFEQHIIDHRTHRFHLFFGEDWTVKSEIISYGHDIEGAWLLWEAAEIAGTQSFNQYSVKMAAATLEGQMPDGSLIYEKEGAHMDLERHWWVQAEAVVGWMYAWRISQDLRFKKAAEKAWSYIRENLIDHQNGEWFWSRLADGTVNHCEDKAGFWKCPYHNGRMCLEMIEHFDLE